MGTVDKMTMDGQISALLGRMLGCQSPHQSWLPGQSKSKRRFSSAFVPLILVIQHADVDHRLIISNQSYALVTQKWFSKPALTKPEAIAPSHFAEDRGETAFQAL